jgi:hypothetical protein
MKPAHGAGGRHAEGHGYGLILFASVLLVIGDPAQRGTVLP